jgi:hypothetical protein
VMDNYSMVSPGAGIGGGIGTSMDGGRGHAIFYVEVSNVAETLTVVEGRGGRTLTGPSRSPTARSSPSSPIPKAMSSAWCRPGRCATADHCSPFNRDKAGRRVSGVAQAVHPRLEPRELPFL